MQNWRNELFSLFLCFQRVLFTKWLVFRPIGPERLYLTLYKVQVIASTYPRGQFVETQYVQYASKCIHLGLRGGTYCTGRQNMYIS